MIVLRACFLKGILHRDISKRNILFTKINGIIQALLIDFEYAVRVGRMGTDAVADRTVRVMNSFCPYFVNFPAFLGNTPIHAD